MGIIKPTFGLSVFKILFKLHKSLSPVSASQSSWVFVLGLWFLFAGFTPKSFADVPSLLLSGDFCTSVMKPFPTIKTTYATSINNLGTYFTPCSTICQVCFGF